MIVRYVIRLSRGIILFISLLYVTVCIPIFGVIYFPGWYTANCGWHDRCQRLGTERSAAHIHELVSFFRHTGELASSAWTTKETRHLTEVRGIFDGLVIAFLPAAVLLFLLGDRRSVRRSALAGFFVIFSTTAVLPFFGYFWRDLFHGALFDNTDWMNTPADISYYIVPRVFFFHTVILVISVAATVNLGVFLTLREKSGASGKSEA